jgi:hypothetical protein
MRVSYVALSHLFELEPQADMVIVCILETSCYSIDIIYFTFIIA